MSITGVPLVNPFPAKCIMDSCPAYIALAEQFNKKRPICLICSPAAISGGVESAGMPIERGVEDGSRGE